jgi:hypothetical protein
MRLLLLILGSLFFASASAGVYKCTDANGKKEYRSSPCETGQGNVEINIKTGASTNLGDVNKQQAIAKKEKEAALEKQKLEQEQRSQKQAELIKEASNESEKNQLLVKNNPDKFSAYAIPPYVPEKLPNLVKTFQDRLPEIERMRRQSAEKALATNQCGRVESAELHSKSTKAELMFLINCSSGKTLYFKEQDLLN